MIDFETEDSYVRRLRERLQAMGDEELRCSILLAHGQLLDRLLDRIFVPINPSPGTHSQFSDYRPKPTMYIDSACRAVIEGS
jgi:hypothetical protein